MKVLILFAIALTLSGTISLLFCPSHFYELFFFASAGSAISNPLFCRLCNGSIWKE